MVWERKEYLHSVARFEVGLAQVAVAIDVETPEPVHDARIRHAILQTAMRRHHRIISAQTHTAAHPPACIPEPLARDEDAMGREEVPPPS